MTAQQIDKGKALADFLDTNGVRYKPTYMGWQSVSCPNTNGHVHGDRTPSARINLTHGGFACMGCGLSGDIYNLIMELNNCDFKQATQLIGTQTPIQQDGDLIL